MPPRLIAVSSVAALAGNAEGQKITFNVIKSRLADTLYKLTTQKFEDPGGQTSSALCGEERMGAGGWAPQQAGCSNLDLRMSTSMHACCTSLTPPPSCGTNSLFLPVCAAEGEETVRAKLRKVNEELVEKFRALEEEFR